MPGHINPTSRTSHDRETKIYENLLAKTLMEGDYCDKSGETCQTPNQNKWLKDVKMLHWTEEIRSQMILLYALSANATFLILNG